MAAPPAAAPEESKDIYQRSAKEKKYDRQMRMWGAHGQKALEEAEICCLGSGPTASETLKNLVLPCVGNFVVVDDAKVTEVDLGNNFFVDEESLGKSRAATVKDLLLEMNPEVKGSALVRNPVDLIDKELSYFDRFRIVIGCHLPEPSVKKLGEYLYPKNIPFIVLRSEGMLGYARLQIQEHLVYESHPEDDRYDLYLHPEQLASFPELQEYIKTFGDFSGLNDKQHGEIPYPVILVVQMQKWLKEHKNQPPSTWEEQDEFKLQIKKGARNFEEQENWEEAVENASKCYKKAELKDEVKEVFDDEKAKKYYER
jgi:amyloid beta precursor protein binding protein 1